MDLAFNEFYNYFNYNIRDLLNNFPRELKINDGTLFWNGDKRMHFSLDYETQVDFIYHYYLIAKNLKVEVKDKNFSIVYISQNMIENKNILNTEEMKIRYKKK